MAGHISYPRTGAAKSAWTDYRRAISLANAGAHEAAISLLQDIIGNPNASLHLKEIAAELLTKLNRVAIAAALASSSPGMRLEGEAATHIMNAGINILAFNKVVGPNGEIGEIDIQTSMAIIETTIARMGKLGQINKIMTNTQLNPDGQPVILDAPNYQVAAGQDIVDAGGLLARTPTALIALLQSLKDR